MTCLDISPPNSQINPKEISILPQLFILTKVLKGWVLFVLKNENGIFLTKGSILPKDLNFRKLERWFGTNHKSLHK